MCLLITQPSRAAAAPTRSGRMQSDPGVLKIVIRQTRSSPALCKAPEESTPIGCPALYNLIFYTPSEPHTLRYLFSPRQCGTGDYALSVFEEEIIIVAELSSSRSYYWVCVSGCPFISVSWQLHSSAWIEDNCSLFWYVYATSIFQYYFFLIVNILYFSCYVVPFVKIAYSVTVRICSWNEH